MSRLYLRRLICKVNGNQSDLERGKHHSSQSLAGCAGGNRESSKVHLPTEDPDKDCQVAGASISRRTTFPSSGLQCYLHTDLCVTFYYVFWTQLCNQQTFLYPQTLIRYFNLFPSTTPRPSHHLSLYQKISAPLKLYCAQLVYPSTTPDFR